MTAASVPPEDADEALAARLRASRTIEDAPESVVQRALGLWRQAAPVAAADATASAPAPGPRAVLRRLVAQLRLDTSGTSPLAHGLRSAGGGTRQLIYFSEGRDIDVRVAPVPTATGRQWRISGQVLGPDVAGMAELRGAGGTRSTAWSDLAEFAFSDLEPGCFTLVLRAADWEMELPPIDVPA